MKNVHFVNTIWVMCNVNESPGNVIYCNLCGWCVFL